MDEKNKVSVSDEEKKAGARVSRKHLLPVFIMEILEKDTDYQHHCTQKFIREKLENYYGVRVTRKVVSAHIHTMLLEELCIFGDERTGYWYDRMAYISGRAG